jgi:hypothetical protein
LNDATGVYARRVPGWVATIITAAAVVTAVGVLWARLVKPLANGLREVAGMVRALREMTDERSAGAPEHRD